MASNQAPNRGEPKMAAEERIRIADNYVESYQGRKTTRRVKLVDYFKKLREKQQTVKIETPVLPVGTIGYFRRGDREYVVLEDQPTTRTIMNGDGERFHLSLPFVVYVFYFDSGYMPEYTSRIFFRNQPVNSLDDELCLCSLTHTNTGDDNHYKVGSVCMKARFSPSASIPEKIAANMRYFWTTSFKSGFGYNDFFTGPDKMRQIDPRVGDFSSWAKETKKESLFSTRVAWLPTGLKIKDTINLEDDRQFEVTEIDNLVDLMQQVPKVEPKEAK